MLSREKQMPLSIGTKKSSSTSIDNHVENDSNKLIFFNINNGKKGNKVSGNQSTRENPISQPIRCCKCPGDTTTICDHHNRYKILPQNSKRLRTGIESQSTTNKTPNNLLQPHKTQISTSSNKNSDKSTPRVDHRVKSVNNQRQRVSHRDMEIINSIPSLCHPNFTVGQRQMLLSLARIYTNVKPRNCPPISFNGGAMWHHSNARSRSMHEKRSKTSQEHKTTKKEDHFGDDSIETAVKTYGNISKPNKAEDKIKVNKRDDSIKTAVKTDGNISKPNKAEDEIKVNKRDDSIQTAVKTSDNISKPNKAEDQIKVNKTAKNDDGGGDLSTELDKLLEDWVVNIIHNQARYLSQELQNDIKYKEDVEIKDEDSVTTEKGTELIDKISTGHSENEERQQQTIDQSQDLSENFDTASDTFKVNSNDDM